MRSKEHNPFAKTFCNVCRTPYCICRETKSWVSLDISDFDTSVTNFLQDRFKRLQEEYEYKKNEVVKERLDILGIEMDLVKEYRKRFKSLVVESGPNEETIYYNDGTEEGLRIVTFIKPKNSIDGNTWSFGLKYY